MILVAAALIGSLVALSGCGLLTKTCPPCAPQAVVSIPPLPPKAALPEWDAERCIVEPACRILIRESFTVLSTDANRCRKAYEGIRELYENE